MIPVPPKTLDQKIADAMRDLKAARAEGSLLRIDLAEATLNNLLEEKAK